VSDDGTVHEAARLKPIHPQGCAVFPADVEQWPLDEETRDGRFDGLPYFLYDMRPQGFLGRNFANANAEQLRVPQDPTQWSDEDILIVLSVAGDDLPGDLIVGETSYAAFARRKVQGISALDEHDIETEYPELAQAVLSGGAVGSSAGGEFPKFTAVRADEGSTRHVIVKFSGDDDTPAVRRWSDLLVCEAIASVTINEQLGIAAADSRIYTFRRRTFLEVTRFDRMGAWGRLPACTIGSVDAALLGLADPTWDRAAEGLRDRGAIDPRTADDIVLLHAFGQQIANTDMHGGNLALKPSDEHLEAAPAYDMLPMAYAPLRGGELPAVGYVVSLPLPRMRATWRRAADAAIQFWRRCGQDERISSSFREIANANATELVRVSALV
jgi:hypothetical protein